MKPSMRAAAGMCGIALALLGAGQAQTPPAQAAHVPVDPSPTIALDAATETFVGTLTPEIQKRLRESLKILVEKKRRLWTVEVQREVRELNRALALDEAAGDAVQKASKQAVEQGLEGWSHLIAKRMRMNFPTDPKIQLSLLARATVVYQWSGAGDSSEGVTEPLESPAWMKTLRAIITPGQAQVWASFLAKRKQDQDKEVNDGLKRLEEPIRKQYEKQMVTRLDEMQNSLGLAPDRFTKLQELSRAALERTLVAWHKSAEGWLRQMEPAQRRNFLRSAGTVSFPQKDELPENQAEWKKGLAELLTPDEAQKLAAGKTAHLERRIRALTDTLILQMDEEVALMKKQREQLDSLAEKLVRTHARLGKEDEAAEEDFDFQEGMFFEASTKAKDEELQPILDARQIQRWREAQTNLLRRQEAQQQEAALAAGDKGKEEGLEPDAEWGERLLSEYLYKRTCDQRLRFLRPLLLQVEDATRVCQLDELTCQMLQTAARGAAEAVLAGWRKQEDSVVRGQIAGVAPRDLKQRLAGLGEFTHTQQPAIAVAKENRWKSAVASGIAPPQMETWQAEKKERHLFRERAIAGLILAETDRRLTLTAQQWEKLQGPMAKTLSEIEEALPTIGFQDVESWYLQSYMMLMPLAGIPEAETKAILTKEQYDTLVSGSEYSNASSYWQNIVANRRTHK